MCGICGFVIQNKEPEQYRDVLAEMTARLAHRGPDGQGVWLGGSGGWTVGLGHRRLAVIDLDPRANQPLGNEDGTVRTVFNGEIYNYPELRLKLRDSGHRFVTTSDTECIVHAYEENGVGHVEQLDGMFAHALWDTPRKRLVLARDRAGMKPLFYARVSRGIVFASEIKSLLHMPGVSRDVDPHGVDLYVTYGYIPGERTIFRSVRKLLPAHTLVFRDGEVRLDRYWSLDYLPKHDRSEDMLAEELRDVMSRAVQRHLVADVPVGAFLSGGVDSSVVVSVAAGMRGGVEDAFSLGFHGGGDELPYARKAARKAGVRHHQHRVSPNLAQSLPELVWNLDEPFFDNSILPTWHISKWARRTHKVVLSGDGGDELFAGYEWARRQQLANWWQKAPGGLRDLLASRLPKYTRGEDYATGFAARITRLARDLNRGVQDGFLRRTSVSRTFRERLYAPELRIRLDHDAAEYQKALFDGARVNDPMEAMLHVDFSSYLPDDCLFKVDRMSMAHGLEVRVPFLDRELIEFAAKVPFRYKLSGLTTKALVKKAFGKDLPNAVLRQRKQGFSVPVSSWLRNGLKHPAHRLLLEKPFTERGLFDTGFVRDMLAQHEAGRQELGHRIFALMVFEVWARLYLDEKIESRPSATLHDMAG
ncbi:MAG: asparagine synthase (glutamine-hydrolyzing) [Desulfatibacillaceae bacterium]